jgi:hypothetical protein
MAISLKLKGVDALKEQLSEESTKLINQAQRISAFRAVSDLVFVTPVDSGRARSAWSLNTSKVLIDSQEGSLAPTPTVRLGPVPTDKIETLYITNGTPYIQDLNAGSSMQAPARFIETTVSKYFNVKGSVARIL